MPTKRERDLEDALNDIMDTLEDHDLIEPPDEDDEESDRGN